MSRNRELSEDPYIYRIANSIYYDEPAHIFGMDYYDPDSKGEDDFTRKTVWFYVYGDEDIEEEFKDRLKDLFKTRFVNDRVDWDLATLYPTHSKGEVNPHLQRLVENVSEELAIDYDQVIVRNQKIEESHELDTPKQKVVNLEGSIDIDGEVEDKNIIVVDNISLSGTSLLHATNRLLDEGAERVACVVLGLSDTMKENDWTDIDRETGASAIMEKFSKEGDAG